MRLAKIAAYDATHGGREFHFSEGRATHFCLLYIVPIMVGLKVCDAQRYAKFIHGEEPTPLKEIADKGMVYGLFDELLALDETFDPKDTQSKCVSLDDKLRAVYDAIFVTEYEGNNYHTVIGSYEFNAQTKETLLRTAGLLSQYTNPALD